MCSVTYTSIACAFARLLIAVTSATVALEFAVEAERASGAGFIALSSTPAGRTAETARTCLVVAQPLFRAVAQVRTFRAPATLRTAHCTVLPMVPCLTFAMTSL